MFLGELGVVLYVGLLVCVVCGFGALRCVFFGPVLRALFQAEHTPGATRNTRPGASAHKASSRLNIRLPAAAIS